MPAPALATLRHTLNKHHPGAPIWLFHHATSTNTLARQRGLPHGGVLVATHQTQGRGQHGRVWTHQPENLAATWAVAGLPPHALGQLPLYTGFCLRRALARHGLTTQLKWPNDVLWQGGKLAGVLVESHTVGQRTQAVVGLGLNLFPVAPAAQTPGHLPPISLHETGVAAAHRLIWLARVLDDFWRGFKDFTGPGRWRQDYEENMAFLGQTVALDVGEDAPLAATLLGVDDTGRLRAQLPNGKSRAFTSARILAGN